MPLKYSSSHFVLFQTHKTFQRYISLPLQRKHADLIPGETEL